MSLAGFHNRTADSNDFSAKEAKKSKNPNTVLGFQLF